MRHERQLVAIPDPAPSIPVHFRLYHGGTSRRGYLVTQDPESSAYLGDYVYFSSIKRYARTYLRRRRGVPSSLFVIDARYLPRGTRVLRTKTMEWPARSVEGRLFDLIDMHWELTIWINLLANSAARTMLDAEAPSKVRDAVVDWLGRVRYLRRESAAADSPPVISARVLRTLRRYFRKFLNPRVAAACAELVPVNDDDYPCGDRWRSLVLFLLDSFGTLDLSVDDLRSAVSTYRDEWLAAFSAPLTASNLDAMRQLGAAGIQAGLSGAVSGLIVVVPGPIPILNSRHRDRTGTKQREPRTP